MASRSTERLSGVLGHLVNPASVSGQPPSPAPAAAAAAEYDLVIRGGTIVDGSGEGRYVGDVGIRGDTIVAVAESLPGRGSTELDAVGKIVTPGWVDVHTCAASRPAASAPPPWAAHRLSRCPTAPARRHFDAQVCWDPYFSPAPHNGATTVVFGNCRVGFAPMRKSSASVEYICNLMEGVE